MATGNMATATILNKNHPATGPLSRDRMNDIFNLSRQLIATNRLDVLLDSIARHATDILQVKFCRIITLEPDGRLVNQAICLSRTLPQEAQERIRQLSPSLKEYRLAISNRGPVLFSRQDPSLTHKVMQDLGLGVIDSLCLVPLQVEAESLGLLALGDGWRMNHEPFEEERLRLANLIADQAASAIYRVRLSNRLKENQLETVLALAKTLEARDLYTGGHSDRMTSLAEQTAAHLNCPFDEIQSIRWASLLHDIGKVGIPDEILRKPASLSKEEWELVKGHPQKGAEIVLMVSNLEHVAVLILAHHEKFDGSGYPFGLQKQRIPLGARIISVVDAYSAMIDGRIYRPPISHAEALAEIQRCAGTHFDPQVVEAFLRIFQ